MSTWFHAPFNIHVQPTFALYLVAPAFDYHPSAAGYPQLDANYLSASQVHAISSTTFSFSLFLYITLNWLPKRVTLFPYSLTNSCFYYKTCRDTFCLEAFIVHGDVNPVSQEPQKKKNLNILWFLSLSTKSVDRVSQSNNWQTSTLKWSCHTKTEKLNYSPTI